jgi:hypothetical protein
VISLPRSQFEAFPTTEIGPAVRGHSTSKAIERLEHLLLIPDPYDVHDRTMRLCGLVRLRRGRSLCLAPYDRSR